MRIAIVVVALCLMCGCSTPDGKLVPSNEVDLGKPAKEWYEFQKYVCEKCGRTTTCPMRIGTIEAGGLYCPYCSKELADKHLSKVKDI